MENGSGGFMSDVTTTGGINGLQLGNQQFTFRSISVSNAVNGIYGTWNWGMTFINTTIDSYAYSLFWVPSHLRLF